MTPMFRALILAALLLVSAAARAEAPVLRIGMQPGMSYLALIIMQNEGLIERHASAAGVPGLKVEWTVSANGSVITDGVLSGNLDLGATGIPAFVTLWAKGRGLVDIKGIASYGSLPGVLVSRNPAVRIIADFTTADRIAVPAAKASIQAILLAMAAEKTFGEGQHDRLDKFEISLSHPDALTAMLSGHSEVNAHFSSAPYYQAELKIPGAHVVLTKEDIFPGPLTHGMMWTTTKFHNANPLILKAVRAALAEAMTVIHTDPPRAARDYMASAREKVDEAEVRDIIRELGDRYETTPRGIFPVARFMHRIGMIKTGPASWRDMFFEEGWDPDGS